jgi:hypothetical protein
MVAANDLLAVGAEGESANGLGLSRDVRSNADSGRAQRADGAARLSIIDSHLPIHPGDAETRALRTESNVEHSVKEVFEP